MKTADIRESFLSFFESKGCRRWPSSSLIPDDPSLLLTTAGMVQFKPVFLGAKDLGFTRATTVQKCVRTTDIDIIGTTGRHHSFFEMLGNFSFGDYFKSEACAWSYEYSTRVLGLDPDRLWFSIYEDDDEAEAIWINEVGVPADRIVRMGAKDNFWSAGPTGPCGPCSELYYDQGPEVGCGSGECAPGCDCDRYLEYWNLVFMQYDRQEDGTLLPLPKQNIDTGMGLERIAAIMQGVHSNFETDEVRSIISLAEEITGATFGVAAKTDTSLRILADHARALAFLIADGILPSNEGRGYVLRRLLRRAVRHGRLLGVEDLFMDRLVAHVIELMGTAYPELIAHRDLIHGIVGSEEERFGATLRTGMSFLETELAGLAESGGTLDGRIAFALHDTYGFPFELTAEIAAEKGIAVDADAFASEMEAQRERARAHVKDDSWNTYGGALSELARTVGPTEVLGYEIDETEATVLGILVDGKPVDQVGAGARCEIVLNRTPFYGEQGGQVGDTGGLESAEGAKIAVEDTKIPESGVYIHVSAVEQGTLSVGDTVHAAIDVMRRERIRRNHTATHLLHWALRLVLGEHATQAGSLVRPDRLRFDFTHFEGLTAEQLDKIERLVNRRVFENLPVRSYETSLSSAREAGVTALFGEKYGEFVRVLEVGTISRELCGGTHVARTSEIGFVKVLSESSVGANLRRIEAVTSFDAYELVRTEETELTQAADALRVPARDVAERAAALVKKVKEMESGAQRIVDVVSADTVGQLMSEVADVGYKLVVARMDPVRAAGMRTAWDVLRARGANAVVLAATDLESGKALLMAAGDDMAVKAGFNAGAAVREMAPLVSGRGGGKPQMAQGGGEDASGIEAALTKARDLLSAS
ncbi:MAG TPA: alanine--tRNA ligase [Coriobacteriia bacterium]|nr:alanine--tRNA ligase [Coriobacteriia bacterium]